MPLSAVAARKAAKQREHSESRVEGRVTPNFIIAEVTPQQGSPLPTNDGNAHSPNEVKANRKRKPGGDDAISGSKRKRSKRLTNGATRYFTAQHLIEGGFTEDEIESRPKSSSRRASSSISIYDIPGGEGFDKNQKRAYSPSRRLDSSEEEDENMDLSLSVDSSAVTQQNNPYQNLFWPKRDINAFPLTPEEIGRCAFTSEADNAAGTMLLLSVNQSISFIGSAQVTVLCGSVSISGTPIYPSTKAHRVYSPKCSILANIISLQSSNVENVPCHMDRIPVRLRKHVEQVDAVLIIQSLQTGVTGLGKIFRPLKDSFEILLDERESEANNAIAVKGFYLVRLSSLFVAMMFLMMCLIDTRLTFNRTPELICSRLPCLIRGKQLFKLLQMDLKLETIISMWVTLSR